MTRQLQDNELGIPVPKLDAYFKPTNNLFPLKIGDELFIDAVDAKINEWLDFRFNIVLNEIGVSEGEPLLSTLTDISNVVSKTVSLFTKCLI